MLTAVPRVAAASNQALAISSDESQRRGDDVGRGLGFGMSLAVVDHAATSSSSKGIPSEIDRQRLNISTRRNDSAAIVDSTVAVVG